MTRILRGILLALLLTCAAVSAAPMEQDAPADPACPGAPAPRLILHGQGRVLPGDSNNVRSQPSRSGELFGAIPGGEQFTVLEGPVCADGMNWWRVDSPSAAGWTVEGVGADYWTEPILPPSESSLPWNNPFRNPDYPVANRMTVGATVRVQTLDGSPLPVYASMDDALASEDAPSDVAPSGELPVNTLVTLDEEGSRGWWRVESNQGVSGWVREAVRKTGTAANMRPTLAPVCPYSEDRVLFLSYDDAVGSNLYTIGRDATHLCNLSYGLQQDFEVYDWSPDGAWIAYSAVLEGTNQCAFGCSGELYVESVDGSVLRQITFDQHAGHVQWSPDGRWLAVQVDGSAPNTRDIRLIAPDGSAERTLFTTEDNFALMRWSPDSTRLAVVEDDEFPSHFSQNIQIIDVESGSVQTLFQSSWRVESLSWSPDSASVTTGTYLANSERALIEIDAATGSAEKLVSGETLGGVYSPDGSRIAFWRVDFGAPRWLEVYDHATGTDTRLATLPGVNGRGISWTPEGDALLIGASGVMQVDAATGALRSLFVGSFGSNWYPPLVQPGSR